VTNVSFHTLIALSWDKFSFVSTYTSYQAAAKIAITLLRQTTFI